MEESKPCFFNPRTTEEAVRSNAPAKMIGAEEKVSGSPPARTSTANCRIDHVSSPQISKNLSGFCSHNSLVQDIRNFGKSDAPARFLFFRLDVWNDFSREVLEILKANFVAGKSTLEVSIDGSSYIFDFLRMSQIDLSTGSQNSIAWIDVNGQCFFPKVVVDEQRSMTCPKLEVEIRIEKGFSPQLDHKSLLRKRSELDPIEEYSDESPDVSSTDSLEQPRWPGVEILNDGDRFYKVVEKLFLTGISRFAPDTTVTSIYKCSHAGSMGNSRLKAFQMRIQMTKATRGSSNVQFGWYGTSAKGVASVVSHGFGQPNNGFLGSQAHGVGVYLSPPHSPYSSALLSEGADDNGEKHVVLCRIIMGKPEKVQAGSHQFHPSSDEFDSGMDDPHNPKWFIVWSTHMNTHILPEYVVSYKSSEQPQGPWRMMNPRRRPNLTSLSFPKLFAEMGRSLPPSRIQALEILYNQHKVGKINKDAFIRYVRSIIGDRLLTSTIRRIQGHS